MLTDFVLSRSEYEAEILLNGKSPPPELAAQLVRSDYPKTTAQARSELLERGFAPSAGDLDYLWQTIELPSVVRESKKGRQWSADAVDAAASRLFEAGKFSDSSCARRRDGVSAVDEIRAFRKAVAENNLPNDPAYFCRCVLPGLPEAGVHGFIRFEPLSLDWLNHRNREAAKVSQNAAAA